MTIPKVMSPSPERLRELFEYDPSTGILRWKTTGKGRRLDRMITTCRTNGYLSVSIDGRALIGHRIIWAIVYGEWPKLEVDHIDGDRANNRVANFRLATRAQNRMNSGSQNKGRGTYRHRHKWYARISINGKVKKLGGFKTMEEAHSVYREAARRIYGEFACLDR